MKVYVLSEEYSHYVDGQWSTLIDIYTKKEDADAEAVILNERDGYGTEYRSKSFVVEEKELK